MSNVLHISDAVNLFAHFNTDNSVIIYVVSPRMISDYSKVKTWLIDIFSKKNTIQGNGCRWQYAGEKSSAT